MVEQAPLEPRRVGEVEPVDRLARLDQAQQPEGAVEHADIGVGERSPSPACSPMRDAADQIALRAKAIERQVQVRRPAALERGVPITIAPSRVTRSAAGSGWPSRPARPRRSSAPAASSVADPLAPTSSVAAGAYRLLPRRLDRAIAQPEVVAVLGARPGRRDHGGQQQQGEQGQAKHHIHFLSTILACTGMAKPRLSW